ncbi:MAG TPA: serine/threonine-protein kinase [Kofleriaceae bacterium]|nr:serine/threonine-protein kinase [Kofleriaceae bacterium]
MSVETQFVPDLPQFGRFRATAELGRGAMGTVYRAEDDTLGREVAIKTLQSTHCDPTLRERFFQEARAVCVLAHPNVVSIFDMGTHDDAPYLVMELAPGGSLEQRLARGRLTASEARGIGIQIAQALAAAHARQILHRDVKPANILLAKNGAWKLADFGIARLPDSKLTITGQFLGSPSYAAPEALMRGEFSAASDVYGLAATLYKTLAGQPPHGDKAITALFTGVAHEAPPLSERVAVPAGLEATIMRALAIDPAERPSAAEFAQLLADEPDAVVAIAEPSTVPAVQGSRLQRWILAGVAAIAIVGLIAAITHGGGDGASATSLSGSPTAPAANAPADDSQAADDPPQPDDDVPVHRGKKSKKKHRD